MTIKDEKTYNEIEERMEALLAKGTQLGGMDFLSEVEKEELKVLSKLLTIGNAKLIPIHGELSLHS